MLRPIQVRWMMKVSATTRASATAITASCPTVTCRLTPAISACSSAEPMLSG